MSIRRPGSPTYCAALPITPPGGCTSCCPGTGTRRRSGTPSPRKISPLLFLQTFLQITRLHAVSLRPRPDAYAQTGVNAVEAIFLSMKWLFRRQLESDFGIDAQAEVVNEEGNPTGQLVAMQIKSGPSFFRPRGEDYVFRGEPRHLDYWERHSLPVILVMHNPVDGMTLWQRVERHLITQGP